MQRSSSPVCLYSGSSTTCELYHSDYKGITAKVFSLPSVLCRLLNICFVTRAASEALSNNTPVFPLVNCKVNALNLQEIFFQGETNLFLNRAVLKVYSSQHWRSIDSSGLRALRVETVVREKNLHFWGGGGEPRVTWLFPSTDVTRAVEKKSSEIQAEVWKLIISELCT